MGEGTPPPSAGELAAIEALATSELCSRVAVAQGEIDQLTARARELVRDVELSYANGVHALDAVHEASLHTVFPGDIPDDYDVHLYQLTGQEALFRSTHDLLHLLHNAVPTYPHMTVGDEGKLS